MKKILEELVQMADMGLLLGAPVMQNCLETIAQVITEHLSQDSIILEVFHMYTYFLVRQIHKKLRI